MDKPNSYYRKLRRGPLLLRIAAGLALVAGGILGFLPILGFWMIPVGLAIIFIDVLSVRRAASRFRAWGRDRLARWLTVLGRWR
jgi:hypothetical protein